VRLGRAHHGRLTGTVAGHGAIRRAVALGLLAPALVSAPGLAHAQRDRPPGPRRPFAAVPANICSTEWGWCQLSTQTAPHGVACWCLTEQDQPVAGITRYWPYEGPPSPYLQPHVAPPSTIR
jgi:hypothetical protein